MTPPAEFTLEMGLVLGMIGLAVFLFVAEWVRVDVVAVLMMVLLPMLGLVSGEQAISGLASNAVVSIIAVIVIGAGLDHTGVINRVARPIVELAGSSRSRVVALLSLTVAVVSSFMQNIGAAALFLPALRRISRQGGIPLGRLLMPIGFSAILGGTVTLVGSSPLILLNDLLAPYDLAPFHLFAPMPVGLALVAAGVGYFLLLGRWALPERGETGRREEGFDPSAAYPQVGELFELTLTREPAGESAVSQLCDQYLAHAVALSYDGGRSRFLPPDRDAKLAAGAELAVYGPREQVEQMARDYGMRLKPELRVFANDLDPELAGVVEAVVTPRSGFQGRTLSEIKFRRHYLVTPLAVMREDQVFYAHLGELTLHAGDAILMHGTWERFHQLRAQRDFLFTHPLDHEIIHPHKAAAAVACFALATFLVLFTDLALSVCLLAGALGMVLFRVLTMDEAYRAVDWRTVFLLAGLIPLGIATQTSGAAAWLAGHVVELLGSPHPVLLYLAVGALSTVFSLVISNVGAVVLLVPLVVNLALGAGADPRLAAFVVGLATSNSFLLPTHQVNALYMGPGRYTSRDFLRAGSGMSVLFLLVMTGMIWLFY